MLASFNTLYDVTNTWVSYFDNLRYPLSPQVYVGADSHAASQVIWGTLLRTPAQGRNSESRVLDSLDILNGSRPVLRLDHSFLPGPYKGLLYWLDSKLHMLSSGLERPRSQDSPEVSGIPSSSPGTHNILCKMCVSHLSRIPELL